MHLIRKFHLLINPCVNAAYTAKFTIIHVMLCPSSVLQLNISLSEQEKTGKELDIKVLFQGRSHNDRVSADVQTVR